MTYAQEIRAHLQNSGVLDPSQAIGDEDSLLELGLIDSMVILDLTAFIAETYGMPVKENDLVPENFDSLAAMQAFIQRRRAT
jgi:acyl carrier protein